MAITGSGISAQDPYMVHTYDELVSAASESGKFIKLANDINITDEYPDGDMPTLEIDSSYIDGDGKTISNWYKKTSGYCINWTNSSDDDSIIKNTVFGNIYINASCNGFYKANTHTVPHFENCGFYGILYNYFKEGEESELKDCTMYLNLKKAVSQGGSAIADFDGIFFNNCYLKADDTTATARRSFFPNFNYRPFAKDSYFEIKTTASSIAQYSDGQGAENCVFDITTDMQWTWGNASGYSCSIFKQSSAPRVEESDNVKAVDDANWLNTAYLSSIGFNAG